MTLLRTDVDIGASHSIFDLGNQHKEKGIQRVCKSEPFIKPHMSHLKLEQSEPQSKKADIDIGAFHSLYDLQSQHKKKKILRVCHSEPFMKPSMSLRKAIQKFWSHLKFKGPVCSKEEKTSVLQEVNNPRTKVQMAITSSTIPEKNKSKLVHLEKQLTKADWEAITRPSAKVILDPNTANPTLMLSMDGRSVRTKTHKEFNSSKSFDESHKKYHHKYNAWMCIQAQEGYITGRHYWEVDVKGKCDWRIGVVKESAPRNGFVKLNTTTGYWTLRLQLGSLIALTEPATKINQPAPSRIGVHLDLEKSRVSFYDAVKRKLIYTFNAKFMQCEKIYPVFGSVETDKPLKII